MASLAFIVVGRPQSAGSRRAFPVRKGGELTGKVTVAPDNPKQKAWQQSVRHAAADAFTDDILLDGPLRLDVAFHMRRPQGHYGTGRNAGQLKAHAPQRPDRKPDLSKLVRALEDGLTGIVIADDARFVTILAEKFYCQGTERTEVLISELGQLRLNVS